MPAQDRTRSSLLSMGMALATVAWAGCLSDTEKPAAPVVLPMPVSTSLPSVVIAGTAEYLATVTIAGGADAATASADARTGVFSAEVTLADGENDLLVTATDAAGNASDPTAVSIRREPPRAEVVRIALASAVVAADAALVVNVEVENDEPAVDLSALGVTVSVTGYAQEVAAIPVTLDAYGHGTVEVHGMTVVGAGVVAATADIAAAAGVPARDEAAFTVVAGTPVNASFFEIDQAFAPYHAGDPIYFLYELVDAFGNVNTDVPVVVTINAPNAAVTDGGDGTGEIDGVVRSGSYTVRARAVGAGIDDDLETVVVDPNPQDAGFNLQLSAGLIVENGSALLVVTDGFGNAVDIDAVTTTFSDETAVVRDGATLTFLRAGTYAVTACLAAAPDVCDTEFISVQGLLDTVPPTATVTVLSPDPAATNEVSQNGSVVFSAETFDDRGLASIRYVASFGSLGNCTRSAGPIFLPGGTTTDARTFVFSVPGCAIPGDPIDIVVQAADEAGNTKNSGGHSPLSVRAAFDIVVGGFTTTVAAWHDQLNQPEFLAVDAQNSTLVLGNRGDDRAMLVTADRAQIRLRDSQGQSVQLSGVRGTAVDATGNMFFNVTNAGGQNGVVRVRPDLTVDTGYINNTRAAGAFPAQGHGLKVDEATALTPLLCAAVRDQDRVQCFTGFSAQDGTAPTLRINFNTNLTNQRPVSVAFDPPSIRSANDRLFVALDQGRKVREYVFDATRSTLTAGQDYDLSSELQAGEMGDVAVAPLSGNLYVTNRAAGRVIKIDPAAAPGSQVSRFATGFQTPVGLAFDGDALLVVDAGDEAVYRVAPAASSPGTF